MKNTNITLAMVAILAAVTMLSAVLAVPMQEANAEKRGDGGYSGNNFKINQENDCERAGCDNDVTATNFQDIEED
jgi:opacity protein-like surface antigen